MTPKNEIETVSRVAFQVPSLPAALLLVLWVAILFLTNLPGWVIWPASFGLGFVASGSWAPTFSVQFPATSQDALEDNEGPRS